MGFQFLQHLEEKAEAFRRLAGFLLLQRVAAQLAQMGEIGMGPGGGNFGKNVFVFQKPRTQALAAVQAGCLLGGFATQQGQPGTDGVGIFIAHQFADVLQLATVRTMGGKPLAIEHGGQQVLRQADPLELAGRQADQSLAEFLQLVHGLLAPGFGGAFAIGKVFVVHRGGSRLGAAMIATFPLFCPLPQIDMPTDSRFSYPFATLQQLARDVLDHAGQKGATACEVDVSEGFGQSVTVRCDEVETIEYNRDKGIGITIYSGQRKGYASTSDFSAQALRETVEAALNIARFTAADDCAGLPEKEQLAQEQLDLDLYHPWVLSVEDAIAAAQACEQAAFDASPKVSNSEGATVSTQEAQFVSANSLGFMGGYPTSRHYISCSVIAGEQDAMQRDDWYTTRRHAGELDAPAVVGRKAAERAVARLGGRRIKTSEVPVLFEAPLAAGLLGSFVHAASGGALYRKASFLVDHLGRQIFPDFINLSERPHIRRGLGSSSFDSDGVATRDREVVTGGVLNGYFLSVYSARKLGMQTTGNAGGSHNLLLASGEHDLAALLKKMGRGLLVTEMLGHGVNYVTGDYSRGASGFWVEDGQIAYPVEEITIAGNLKDMLRGIVAVGNDVETRGSKQTGSLLLERMMVAGE